MPGCPTPTAPKPNAGLGSVPAGIEFDFYRADGEALPATLDEVAFYVLPYMRGAKVLDRAADMPKLQVVQTLTAG